LCRQGKFSWNEKHFGIEANVSIQDREPIRLSAGEDRSLREGIKESPSRNSAGQVYPLVKGELP
jgi:hypothetical protein